VATTDCVTEAQTVHSSLIFAYFEMQQQRQQQQQQLIL